MNKKFTCFFIGLFALVFTSTLAQAAIINSTASGGNWSAPSTWVGGVVPGAGDAVNVVSGASVIVNVTATCLTLYLNVDGSAYSLIISGTNTLTVVGNATIDGNGSATSTLSVGIGVLNVGGDLTLVAPPGFANLELGDATGDGTVHIGGDLIFSGGGGAITKRNLNGDGIIYVEGTQQGSGTTETGVTVVLNSLGYFRSKTTGNWSSLSSWESSYNGTSNWVNATLIPTSAAIRIAVLATHTITVNQAVTATNLIVNNNGTLNCSTFQISGPGPFDLQAGANIITAHANGLGASGSILVTGASTFSSAANYSFLGAATGVFTTSTPQTCNNVTISNAAGVSLSSALAVNGILTITGKFNIGSNTLTVNGAIAGANTVNGLVGSGTSNLVVGGTAVNLNLGFDQSNTASRTLQNYTQSRNATATLVNPLEVTGIVNISGTAATLASAGFLTLISTATANANVAALSSTSFITGNVNVQSWFTGGSAVMRSTRMLSPPIDDNLTSAGNKVYQQLKQYMVITGPGNISNNFDLGNNTQTNAITLTKYTEANTLAQAQFTPIASLSNASVPIAKPGEGFFLFYRGDRTGYTQATASTSNKVNAPFAVPESLTATYLGPINQGNISATLANANNAGDTNNGYNELGNPYPATIDFNSLFTNNSAAIANQYIVIRPDMGGTMSYSLNSGGILTNGGAITLAQARYIQPGQGFYIKKSAAGTVSYPSFFTENIKAVSNAPARLLSLPFDKTVWATTIMSTMPAAQFSAKALRFNLQNSVNTDEAVVIFQDGYRAEYEHADAAYFSGSTVTLSSISSDGKNMAINFMPDIKEVTELKLNVNASSSGPVKLNFTDLSAVGNYQLSLKDNYNSTSTDLKSNPVYEFVIDKSIAGTYGASRFALMLQPPISLPVQLASFNVKKIDTEVELNWVTSIEKNTAHFDLEHSVNGIDYSKIGEVKGAGSSNTLLSYSFLDKNPVDGINYYRLKQVSLNGEFSYSEARTLVYTNVTEPEITLYPNPANNQINIKFPANVHPDVEMKISNATGRLIKALSFNKLIANSVITQDITGLKPGFYIIEVKDAKTREVISLLRLIKE